MTDDLLDTIRQHNETAQNQINMRAIKGNMGILQGDLFAPKKTKEELLAEFCQSKGFFSSHDINFFGTTHFYDSATRRIREWVNEGKVKRLSEDDKVFRGFKTKCAVYCWVGE